MTVKTKLRAILKDSLAVLDIGSDAKNRTINKQLIKHIVIDDAALPNNLASQSTGGFIRVLASDLKNAKTIASTLKENTDELGIKSVHITDKIFDYHIKPASQLPIFNHSVLVKLDPQVALVSLIKNSTQDVLRDEILERKPDDNQDTGPASGRILIDYSSPNIAKPFHFGHLKSTIIGNYLANLNKFVGNQVTRLNYIGDWGTQYGLLTLGLEEQGSHGVPKEAPLRYLLDVYVAAVERGKSDESFYRKARERFISLEEGTDLNLLERWRQIRDISLNELKDSYANLGVEFDVFDCESNYAKKSLEMVDLMKSKNLLHQRDDGVISIHVEKNYKQIEVPLLKSDGAGLYITRDVAAAVNRRENYNFDKMLYVVGADQEKHFHSLREIIRKTGYDWADSLLHVKVGKIIGMSTRSGNFVLLDDIINEATKRYIETTENVPTSKLDNPKEIKETGKQLALSALFVYDLRNPRAKNYEFKWDQVMIARERSGIHLQTTYARLCSLMRKCTAEGIAIYENDSLDSLEAIRTVEGMNLVSVLSEFDTELHRSYWSMDPSVLVNHALRLCKSINRARQSNLLQVVWEPDEKKARTRLTLFECARRQLETMIKMIGLKPLERV